MMGVSPRYAAIAAGFVGLMTACGAGQREGDGSTGTARLQLESTGTLGHRYKLAKAVFSITGPGTAEDVSDETGQHWIPVVLPVGSYSVLLNDGWHLQRAEGGGFVDVPTARLVSANPASADVQNQATTDIVFAFDVTGEQVKFGSGLARIGFTVNEGVCGNGVVDPGEECDFMAPDAPPGCGSDCTGGKTCGADAECQSGTCSGQFCNACGNDETACNGDCASAQSDCHHACSNDDSACAAACPAYEGDASCQSSCDQTNCFLFCGGFPPACAICVNDQNNCLAACAQKKKAHDDCLSGCAGTRTACTTVCDATGQSCRDACHADGNACLSTCHRCVSCATAGACPNQP